VLQAVLDGRKNPTGTARLTDSSDTANPQHRPDFFSSIISTMGNDPSSVAVGVDMRAMDVSLESYQKQTRIALTLDALDNLSRYLSGLPGRKNLLWFSGSFPINILPSPGVKYPFDSAASFENQFHRVVGELMRSQVAVYPIDGRGLMLGPPANTQDTVALPLATAVVMRDPKKFFDETASDHATMQDMANETGGMAFINTNNLTAAVKQAIEEGANYYTLTYTPSNREFHGDFRKIQVQLANAGLKLMYRHGYFADDLEAPALAKPDIADAPQDAAPLQLGKPSAAVAQSPNGLDPKGSAMRAAMQFGGPDPTEILFKAAINPVDGEPEVTVARGNRLEPSFSGPFKRCVVYIAVLPTDIRITPLPDGKYRLGVEMVTRVYNSNGELETSATTQAAGDIDGARYAVLMRGGLQFRQEISVPVKGQTFLRVGVHDLLANRVGAVEVPVSTVAKLKAVSGTTVTSK
jgi:VWFA-related protein